MRDDRTHRPFGPLSQAVPIIGQGTWKMGVAGARAAEIAALRRGLDLGLYHIDTAEMYGNGLAEQVVAEAIAGVPREQLFIVSKVLPQNATYQGTIAACEASLRRLRLEHLDVYLLHWRGRHPLSETVRALEDLVDAGKIRGLGVSNFDVADLDEARALLRRHPLVCNQVLYHLGGRYIENELLDYCQRHGIALVGYSPFGVGAFPSPASRQGRLLAAVAARQEAGCTPRQVALAFLARRAPLFAIPKAVQPHHVDDNARALQLVLSEEDLRDLDEAFPRDPSAVTLPMA